MDLKDIVPSPRRQSQTAHDVPDRDIPERWKMTNAGGGPDVLRLTAYNEVPSADKKEASGIQPVAFKDAEPVGCSEAGSQQVRSAGPEAMRDPPARWDRIDEASDESFPASDPPPVSPGPATQPPRAKKTSQP